MTVSLHDVHEALAQLGKLRFGEMRVEDAMHEIVQTTMRSSTWTGPA